MENLAASGADLIYSFSFVLLAEVYIMMNRREDSMEVLDKAAQRCEQSDIRLLEVEIHRLRGETMLFYPDGAAEAERYLRRGIEVARESGALSWELRVAASLARMLAGIGRRDEAVVAVKTALAKFTEGFETYDLIQAKSILAELGS